jgi:hypothetical protein
MMAVGVFNFGSTWKSVFSFAFRPIWLYGKIRQNALNGRVGGPQSRSGQFDIFLAATINRDTNCPTIDGSVFTIPAETWDILWSEIHTTSRNSLGRLTSALTQSSAGV